jgi:hypothetical protein
MTNEVTTLLRSPGVVDPGRVDDDGTERCDPEVPEKAKRRAFTAKYKLEILAESDAAPEGEGGVVAPRGLVPRCSMKASTLAPSRPYISAHCSCPAAMGHL